MLNKKDREDCIKAMFLQTLANDYHYTRHVEGDELERERGKIKGRLTTMFIFFTETLEKITKADILRTVTIDDSCLISQKDKALYSPAYNKELFVYIEDKLFTTRNLRGVK